LGCEVKVINLFSSTYPAAHSEPPCAVGSAALGAASNRIGTGTGTRTVQRVSEILTGSQARQDRQAIQSVGLAASVPTDEHSQLLERDRGVPEALKLP
jgi:hypothetical protein